MASIPSVTVKVKPELDWSEFGIRDVRRLNVQPGDTLLVECDTHLSPQQADAFHQRLLAKFPDVPVVVFSPGVHLSVIRPVED